MRNFRKLKCIEDYKVLDIPERIVTLDLENAAGWTQIDTPAPPVDTMMVLRMLVRPKYGEFVIPPELSFLSDIIHSMSEADQYRTKITQSWCYVTVRHGLVQSTTDDEWHFDGSSFRTDIIPERNYVWVNNHPTEYKVGELNIPSDFDPIKHNLFTFAAHQLADNPIIITAVKQWYLLSPFCLHRRPVIKEPVHRTFYRICFTDIEGRDINNTPNPLLETEFYGRNPVATFRNNLKDYYEKNSL